MIYWLNKPDKEFDIASLMEDFESPSGAKALWKERIHCLSLGDKKCRKAAKRLKRCKSKPCMSPACPICMKHYRQWYSGCGLKLLKQLDDDGQLDVSLLKFVTIVPLNIEKELHELLNKDCPPRLYLKRMKDRLRNQLIRAGLTNLIIFGGIEGDFDVPTQKWEFHFHLIVVGLDEYCPQWKSFLIKNGYAENALHGDTPVQVDPMKNWPRQVSYCLKASFMRKEKWRDKETQEREGRKVPLKPTQMRIALRFLNEIEMSDRMFLFNIRRVGCEFKLASVSEKTAKKQQKMV